MEPQQILIHLIQAWEHLFEDTNHSDKRLEIAHIPILVVFWEKRTVPKAMIKNCLIRVGGPKPKIRKPQALDRSHRVREHNQWIELQALKNLCRLFVYIGKTFYQQLILSIKVTVDRSC